VSDHSIDPNDVAAATAVGAAVRVGAKRYRNSRSEGEATGAAAGAASGVKKRKRRGSLALTAIAFVLLLFAVLALMIALGA
jgi:hypothetical protein